MTSLFVTRSYGGNAIDGESRPVLPHAFAGSHGTDDCDGVINYRPGTREGKPSVEYTWEGNGWRYILVRPCKAESRTKSGELARVAR